MASTKYSPARDGSNRSRRCTTPVSASTASASSNGTIRVSSPRCPGPKTPAATVTVQVTVRVSAPAARMADWVRIGTPVISDLVIT